VSARCYELVLMKLPLQVARDNHDLHLLYLLMIPENLGK